VDIAKSIKQQGANFVANAVKTLQHKLEHEKESIFPAASAKAKPYVALPVAPPPPTQQAMVVVQNDVIDLT
jgi:hypothetical protein